VLEDVPNREVAADWNFLTLVRFETRNCTIKLVLRGTSISFVAFTNDTEPPKAAR
jgi:hypothetical protein